MSDEQEQKRAEVSDLARRFRLDPGAVDAYLRQQPDGPEMVRLRELARRFRLNGHITPDDLKEAAEHGHK